jgi:hypothetical protein
MPTVVDAVLSLVPGANPFLDFDVVDRLDGKGPVLEGWRRKEPKPTPEQISAEIARLTSLSPVPRKPTLTLADVIAVLTPEQQAALQQKLAEPVVLGSSDRVSVVKQETALAEEQ